MSKAKEAKATHPKHVEPEKGTMEVRKKTETMPSLLEDPTTFMHHFREAIDQVFTEFGLGRPWPTLELERLRPSWLPGELTKAMWTPLVETLERDGKFLIRAEIPGVEKKDIKIELLGDMLVIRGERRHEMEEKKEGFFRTERHYGSFSRRIRLPEGVLTDDVKATFKDGVLEITMKAPAHEPPRAREIPIGGTV